MPLRHLDRIRMPDGETFWRDYILTRTPVIMTDLFEQQAIRNVRSLDDARRAFGGIKLSVRPEAVSAATSERPAAPEVMTFDEYWSFVRAHPETDLICSEYEIPARVMTLFELPACCLSRDVNGPELLSLPRKYGDHDLLSNVFVANRGNRAHLHYDGDHRQVLLYQVFGRKRVFLFDPQSGDKLRPLDSLVGFSGVPLEHMTEAQKLEIVDAADGYIGMLHPGDAIFMPMLIWHYLEYTDDAMSLNIRFGRNKYGRFLCVDHFHRDTFIQTFASRLADDGEHDAFAARVAPIVEAYLGPVPVAEKVRRMRRIFKQRCGEWLSDAWVAAVCPADREEREIDRILKDIGARLCYADPQTLARARPVGQATPAQRRHLDETAHTRGYSAQTFERVLMNRVGKRDAGALTQLEVAQLMSYMRSPGAAW